MNQKQFEEIVTETENDIKENLKKLCEQLSGYYFKPTPGVYEPTKAKEYLRGYINSSYERLEKISSNFGFEYKRPFCDIERLLNEINEKAKKNADDFAEIVQRLPAYGDDDLEKQLDKFEEISKKDMDNFVEALLPSSS